MKFNKWTLGLAAVGAISLTSVAQAEEKLNVLQTAMTSTTISGYVDTSLQINPGPGNPGLTPGYAFGGPSKANDFNLNVVQLSIAKPLDESEWAAGYRADMWFGPDANTLNTTSTFGGNTSDFAIRQAYVALRTPVGNGIDWKMGVFDNIIGYESIESGNNPNMSRSYGYTIEPTTLTGLLGTYRFADWMSASFGIADTVGPTINQRAGNPLTAPDQSSWKAYAGSIALTAPSDWGWLAGSTLYSGLLTGFDASSGNPVTGAGNGARNNYYVGMTLTTPVTGLKVGTAVDFVHIRGGTVAGITPTAVVAGVPVYGPVTDMYAVSVYASYQATEKMSLHARGEWYHQDGNVTASANTVAAFTGTLQYDLWQNVLSRLEVRWDYSDDAAYGKTTDLQHNAFMIAANVIYKF